MTAAEDTRRRWYGGGKWPRTLYGVENKVRKSLKGRSVENATVVVESRFGHGSHHAQSGAGRGTGRRSGRGQSVRRWQRRQALVQAAARSTRLPSAVTHLTSDATTRHSDRRDRHLSPVSTASASARSATTTAATTATTTTTLTLLLPLVAVDPDPGFMLTTLCPDDRSFI